jgi:hypothetical protein
MTTPSPSLASLEALAGPVGRTARWQRRLTTVALAMVAFGLVAGASAFVFGWSQALGSRVMPQALLAVVVGVTVRRLAVDGGPVLSNLARGAEALLFVLAILLFLSEAAVLLPRAAGAAF